MVFIATYDWLRRACIQISIYRTVGKETRSVFASCAAAVAAKITSRPVRLTLSRDVDMSITGTR